MTPEETILYGMGYTDSGKALAKKLIPTLMAAVEIMELDSGMSTSEMTRFVQGLVASVFMRDPRSVYKRDMELRP